jgi:hypothetical protein
MDTTTVLQHLQRCQTSNLRRSLQKLLDPANATQLLEELPQRRPTYRTHLYLDSLTSSMRHFRMRDASAQKMLLHSFAADLKEGYCPYLAEDHAEQFPFYLQYRMKSSMDVHQLCRIMHDFVLRFTQTDSQPCYCFAERSSVEWCVVRMHWPLLMVAEAVAAQLQECAIQGAIARCGADCIQHARGWEVRYSTPLPMLGCGGDVHTCESCLNQATRRDACAGCGGLGLQVFPQKLVPVLVLHSTGEVLREDQRNLGIVPSDWDLPDWDLDHANVIALREMLEYTSVRALLPKCRYAEGGGGRRIDTLFCTVVAPPLCLAPCLLCQHLMPSSQLVCRCKNKRRVQRSDLQKKYEMIPVAAHHMAVDAIERIVKSASIDPYLHMLMRDHHFPGVPSLEEAGLSFVLETGDSEERKAAMEHSLQTYKKTYGNFLPEKVRQEMRKMESLMADWPTSAMCLPYMYTRIGRIERLVGRRTKTTDKYVVTLQGLGSAYCPGMCRSHAEPCQIILDRHEGCQYRCQDAQCTQRYPWLKTAAFLRHHATLFMEQRSAHPPPHISAEAMRCGVKRARLCDALISYYSAPQ